MNTKFDLAKGRAMTQALLSAMSDSCYKNFIVLASQPSNLPSGESIRWPYQVFHDCQKRRCPIRYANIPFSGLDSLNKYGLRYARSKNEESAFCTCAYLLTAQKQ